LLLQNLGIPFVQFVCVVLADDIQSNIDTSAGATSQAKVQLVKASKSVKSKNKLVSHKDRNILLSIS
jgi:LAS superfamily LD-carboxypeptidase LdcB